MTYRGLDNPWPYRHFVAQAIRGEIKRQFARSRLGTLWLVLHPLARAAIFAVVFSEVLVVRLPGVENVYGYTIYLMSGMCAWGLFNDIVARSSTIFLDYAATMKKIPFSHFCIPAIACGGAIFSHLLLLLATLLAVVVLGKPPGLAWLALIPGMVLLALLGTGLGLILGIFNVFKRDVAQLTGIVLQIWFWLTPIIYVTETLPKKYRWIADLNPLAPVVRIYQQAMLFDTVPPVDSLIVPLLLGGAVTIASLALLRRASGDLVDSL